MQLGIHVPNFKFVGGTPAIAPELARVAEAAEAAGATWLSVMDHYFQMDQMAPAEDPMLEGYTTLGFWAAAAEASPPRNAKIEKNEKRARRGRREFTGKVRLA